ncbi:MAG TPA: hypothetical protein VM165_06805 [Planctomycetaceae bacterium]|nr:hypothetical protein [Planctomycetaceae bacterium]
MMPSRTLLAVVATGLLSLTAVAPCVSADDVTASGVKRALIVCGLSGDAGRHKQFAETIGRLRDGLVGQLQFAETDIEVLFGDEPADGDADAIRTSARATREEFELRARALRERTRPEDGVWVIVLGHSHYDGRQSWLNLPGPDLHQGEFAKLFEGLTAREQVFIVTTPTSGFFVKPLSAKGRVVITATEADWETNETEFPHEFARVLSGLETAENLDVDKDGRVSLFDLYVTVVRTLAQSYLERELLATEHALLDDDGDGRGTEVQIDYLTIDQGGRLQPNRPASPPVMTKGDGVLAKTVNLRRAN